MKKILTKIFMVVTATLLFTPAVNYSETTNEALKLYVNVPYTLFVSGPIRVSVDNPNVLDVVQVTKKEITLSPKAVGRTSLAVLDLYGEQIYSVIVYAENMEAVKKRVDNLLAKLNFPEVYTQLEDEEAKVYILGKVKTAQERERVNSLLGSLKDKTVDLLSIKEEELAIEIDVQVLELDKDASSSLGFTWPSSINIIEQGSPGIAAGGTSFGKLFKLFNVQRGISDGAGGSVIDPYTVRLDALIQEGKARILSRPRLVCQSGKEAKLLVGGEVPIFTADIGAGGS
ncbi:MAG: pilus assembly protein N-terminal domain-containing protein, partial [Candidatus Omnitrophica bacterium]|nr:pilus assembly protein N-terminal domain-containing protein [Candidatus Omnitrophota bacterium]